LGSGAVVPEFGGQVLPLSEQCGEGRVFIEKDAAVAFGRGQTDRLFQTFESCCWVIEGPVGERLQQIDGDEGAAAALLLSDLFELPEPILRRAHLALREQQANENHIFIRRAISGVDGQVGQSKGRGGNLALS
jgi:hypothetical protein